MEKLQLQLLLQHQLLWIVFYKDEGNREDCSVYYCFHTLAKDKKEAIEKVAKAKGCEEGRLDAEMVQLI